MEVMKELNGYLEHNGLIYKIQSIEQLRDFMNGLGEKAKEMTEKELASLCVNPNPKGYLDKQYNDSCWVLYSIDGKKLIKGSLELKEYKIADGTVAVCNNAFNLSEMQQNNSKKIFCPNTLVAIGEYAFCNAKVKEIIWSPSLKYIGSYAFYGCSLIKLEQELDLPQSLNYIGANAFYGCRRFTSVSFPDSIIKIDSHAFSNCESLKWVYVPDTIKEIGSGVFDGCTSLKEIKIPKGSHTKFEKLLPFSVDKFVEV